MSLHIGHVIIILCCLGPVYSYPGRWAYLNLANNQVENLADVGFSPIHDHSLVFAAQACESLLITFTEKLDHSKGHVMVVIGHEGNNYTMLVPSTHCEGEGGCSATDFVAGHFLDCNAAKYFWLKWDNHGILELGHGYVIGKDMFLHTNYSGEFPLNSVTFRILHKDGGKAAVNIDTRPKFIHPSADGTHSLVVNETAETGVEIITLEAKDPEGDNVTFAVIGKFASVFNITGNRFYNIMPLDFETRCAYDVTISASDVTGAVYTTLTIRVGDVVDEPPLLTITPVGIPEEVTVGTAVDGGFFVRDMDINDTETFSLSGPNADFFTILDDWKFEVVKRIDFDNGTQFLDDLLLTVTDSAGLNTSARLNITVIDMNDNPPVFSQQIYHTSIAEGSSNNTKLVQVLCTDADSGTNGEYVLNITDGDNDKDPAFTLDPSTLELIADGSKIDFEKNESFILTIRAMDMPTYDFPNTAYATVVVLVSPVNEHRPVLTSPQTSTKIPESASPGTVLFTVNVTDDDAGRDGDVMLSILSIQNSLQEQVEDIFSLSQAGQLTVSSDLDVDVLDDRTATYKVVINARDRGNLSLDANLSLTVNVTNVNDNPPYFSDFSSNIRVGEDTAIGNVVYNVNATDVDGDDFNVLLLSDGNNTFKIQGNAILVSSPLDYESSPYHTLHVSLADGTYNVTQTVVVEVLDVIDEPPSIKGYPGASIHEELPANATIGGLFTAADSDKRDVLSFSLAGDQSSFFAIDNSSGVVRIRKRIDLESLAQPYLDQLNITVIDSAGLAATIQLNISILNVQEPTVNRPTFSSSLYQVSVVENTANGTILTLECATCDTFTIVSGNKDKAFTMKGPDLCVTGSVDYESRNKQNFIYSLLVQGSGTDDTSNAGHTAVIVKVLPSNEHAPTWISRLDAGGYLPNVSVNEESIGSVVGTFQARDEDVGTDGRLVYEIVNGSEEFNIDRNTGVLTAAGRLDRETMSGDILELTIKVTDMGKPPLSSTASVKISVLNINDNPPVMASPERKVRVLENSTIGDELLEITTFDVDGDTVIVNVTKGDDLIAVKDTVLVLKKAIADIADPCPQVTLGLSDGKYTTEYTYTIQVLATSIGKPKVAFAEQFSIVEETSIGSVIGGLFTIVSDGGSSLSYSLSENNNSVLAIDKNSGEITISKRIDRDGESGMTSLSDVKVTIVDNLGREISKTFNISITDINDNAPVFSQNIYTVNITENSTDGSILTINVTDKDGDDNGRVFLRMRDIDRKSYIDLQSNKLVVNASDIDYDDPECPESVVLLLEASDQPINSQGFTSQATVIVRVLPRNEHSPVIANATWRLDVPEGMSSGSVIWTGSATDEDRGIGGNLIFSIISVVDGTGSPQNNTFDINASGQLRAASSLDSDISSGGVRNYVIVYSVTDDGIPSKSVQGEITLNLLPVNEYPPKLKPLPERFDLEDDVSMGTVIHVVDVVDEDGDDISISITDNVFRLDGPNITLINKLEYSKHNCKLFTISASDGKFFVSKSFIINIKQGNMSGSTRLKIRTLTSPVLLEEQPVGTPISLFQGIEGGEPPLKYQLSGDGSEYLSIDESTGAVRTNTVIDYDGENGTKTLEDLTLTVTDVAGQQDWTTFNIEVTDLNDNPPTCTQDTYNIRVTENTPLDELLLELNCFDLDDNSFGKFTATITREGNLSEYFTLNSTKILTGGKTLDLESLLDDSLNSLKIILVDNPDGNVHLSSMVFINVQVTGENEFTPVWKNMTLSDVYIDEDTALGSNVMTFKAQDDDFGDDGFVQFSIKSITSDTVQNAEQSFTLNTKSGILRTSSVLDADVDSGATFNVTVVAKDGGSPSKSVELSQVIIVKNVNDNPPSLDLNAITIYENTSRGETIMTLPPKDVDGDNVMYATNSTRFTVNGFSLVLNEMMDFEKEKCHHIELSATDGIFTSTSIITINVLDTNDEVPMIMTTPVNLLEEQPAGTTIRGVFSVIDKDLNDTLSYSIQGNTDLIGINSSSGELFLKKILDFESDGFNSNFGTTLTVVDAGGHTATEALTFDVIDINDNTPRCSQTVLTVKVTENVSDNSTLVNLDCEDSDGGDNGKLNFTITAGDIHNSFYITGSSVRVASVDYEKLESQDFQYKLTIAVSDMSAREARRTSFVTVVVKVLPVNEFTPSWTSPSPSSSGQFPPKTVSENSDPGTVIGRFVASDLDKGDDGEVKYSIVSAVSANGKDSLSFFAMDETTGDLIISKPLDIDELTGGSPIHDVIIRARDCGKSPKEVTGSIQITVSNFNDNPPKLSQSLYSASVTCDSYHGDVVASVKATDADGDILSFSMKDKTSFVNINETSGTITLYYTPAELNKPEVTSDVFVVIVKDGGAPELTDEAVVYLTFQDCSRPTVSTTTSTTTTLMTTAYVENISLEGVNSTTCSPSRGEVLELMATRTACGVLGVGLVSAIALHFKMFRAHKAAMGAIRPKSNTVGHMGPFERGCSAGRQVPINETDDYLPPVDTPRGRLEFSRAPVGYKNMKYLRQ